MHIKLHPKCIERTVFKGSDLNPSTLDQDRTSSFGRLTSSTEMKHIPVLLIISLIPSATSEIHPDRVLNLPGAPAEPVFPLYSGFLNVSESGAEHNVFYVLAEAIRVNPSEAPLIVWLNGAPGWSSLIGLLTENGPFLIDSNTGKLRYNDFSWNQAISFYANVLYIESPFNIGFSYTKNFADFLMTHKPFNDSMTASLNRKALEAFMTSVHPRYATRDYYLTGLSYAGAYIPHLTREILNHTTTGGFTNRNLKGIAMGNAFVDSFSYEIAAVIQLYGMGIIPEKNGEKLFDNWKQTLSRERSVEPENVYTLQPVLNSLRFITHTYLPAECNDAEDYTHWHISKPVTNVQCEWRNLTGTYLNREEVQKALHVRTNDRPTIKWAYMNMIISGEYSKDEDIIPVYKDIIRAAPDCFRILFYTGDMDLGYSPLHVAFGARRIAEKNEMKVVASSPNWRYLGDFGGARTSYETKNGSISMDVLTVRGAGQFVAGTRPDRAFQLINNFITAESSKLVDYSKKIPRR